jgi:hypothetical protein
VGVLVALALGSAHAYAAEAPTAADVLSGFDPARPGYGVDSYWPDSIDHDMANAVYTSAVAKLGDVARTRVGADYLVAHAYDNPKGVGWGLGFPWRACAWQSRRTNRDNTIYMVYTAEGVDALLDAYALTGDVRYKDTAAAALADQDKYFRATMTGRHRTGWFPYSTSAANANCEVYNVLGLQMGTYARAAIAFGSPHYADIAARLHNELWLHRLETETSIWWRYAADCAGPQDAIHEGFIAHGFSEFTKYLGARHDETKLVNFLTTAYEDPLKVNLWGLGELIGVLAERGKTAEAEALRQRIPSYEYAPGSYAFAPGRSGPEFVRQRAYLLRGLVELESAGDK